MEEFVRYEDENGVKVTGQTVIVNGDEISLGELSEIRLERKPPSRFPSFIFFIAGVIGLVIGSLGMMSSVNSDWRTFMNSMDSETLYFGAGVVFILTAIVIMVFQQDKFAISANIRGKKMDIIITRSRQYAANVAGALKAAHSRFVPTH